MDNQVRILNYRLLARVCVAPVNAELLKSLSELDPQQFDADVALVWGDIIEQASQTEVSLLDDEFHRLFIGLGRGELLPYWSFYQTGFLMEKPLVELRRYLNRQGFKRQANSRESEDHIAALFEIMALLISEENHQQKDFFNYFLITWAGDFFQDMENASNLPFYTAIANLGNHFMQIERSLFPE
jgi:TorA maturation chaperone TorD